MPVVAPSLAHEGLDEGLGFGERGAALEGEGGFSVALGLFFDLAAQASLLILGVEEGWPWDSEAARLGLGVVRGGDGCARSRCCCCCCCESCHFDLRR